MPGCRPLRRALAAGLALAALLAAEAQALTLQLVAPEFAGVCEPTACQVALFEFEIPASEFIASAMIGGTFGDPQGNTTAPVTLSVDGLQVASCQQSDACFGSRAPWSHVFAAGELALLADGSASLGAAQNGFAMVRLGETTLTITTVPEPSSLLLLGFGVFALSARRRLRPPEDSPIRS